MGQPLHSKENTIYLDYEKHKEGVYVIDIEADSLHPSIIWVLCWINILTKEKGEARGHEEIKKFFETTKGAIYVGHNILKYDGPVCNRLLGTSLSARNCIDTLVLSTLYSPSISGGHSLGAWGERIGVAKDDFKDFDFFSEEMVKYCHKDVRITANVFVRLMKTLARIGFSEQSIWIQHNITEVLDRQHQNGFEFDYPRALSLYSRLRGIESALTDEIRKVFEPKRVFVARRKKYKKDGSHTIQYLKDREKYVLTELGEEYIASEDVEFNVGSPKQRVEKLTELGWEPQEFTEKGTPRPFDKGALSPSLEKFLEDRDIPEVKMIARWMTINGRANMINTWLENFHETTGRIHGKIFVADTLRFRHQSPNTANIPAVRVGKEGHVLLAEDGDYTYEARDLWISRKTRYLVGTDAAGLELRMLAHFLNRPDFTDQVVNGDPHQYNADVVGITRPQAKTLIYAIMYGAAAPKIAKTLGVPVKEGARIRQMFLERLGLKALIEECQREQAAGRVSLVDGSQVICPSPHAALNYKLQGSGARVMALAACLLERDIQRLGLDSIKVGDIHDEWQYDVSDEDKETHASLAVDKIVQAGVLLKMNVPLGGESKIGRTWAETH